VKMPLLFRAEENMWLELVRIKWSNMKADVAYSKVVTCTNVIAIKVPVEVSFHSDINVNLEVVV